MSEIRSFNPWDINPIHGIESVGYKIAFLRDNPDYFQPDGIWVYCGPQGSGKTLSAVRCLRNILRQYPKAVVCSNIDLPTIDHDVIPFVDYNQLGTLTNGIAGVIFFLDEIHVLWNSLESRSIPISEMAVFCQMRKDRRVIIGTSQVYSRIAKPIREQLKYIIDCHNYFGLFQRNDLIDPTDAVEKDGHVCGVSIGSSCFFHCPDDYRSYDTYNKVFRVKRGV